MQRLSSLPPTRPLWKRWEWIAGAAAAGLLVGLASIAFRSDPGELAGGRPVPPPQAASEADSANAEVDALRMALDREIEAREQLALEVQSLRAQLEGSSAGADSRADSPANARNSDHRSMFDRERLVAAGVAPVEAQELRARWERLQMDKLRLVDRATREGWLGTARYRWELGNLDRNLRQELSAENYDRYLYAIGKSNRARVTDVLARSPADDAGFLPGDTILSYDGERVYTIEEMRDLATQSSGGGSIPVEVVRNGSPITLSVPSGPLGLLLAPARHAPR